jgi:hypothetical protein
MTTWVENPTGGRERGARAVLRAWVEVLVRPRRFFRNGVAPGDQAPGFVFATGVALVAVSSHVWTHPSVVPPAAGPRSLAAVLVVGGVALLAAPLALHLVAALQTLLLVAFVEERAGVSETVQVLAYATAPCVVAGVGVPAVTLLAGAWGAALFAVGVAVVHEVSLPRAVALTALPSALAFGYGYRAFAAASALGVA